MKIFALLLLLLPIVLTGCRPKPAEDLPGLVGQPIDPRSRIPDSIAGLEVTRVEPIEGELRDFGDEDLASSGRAQAELEATADSRGFGDVNPCELITPNDLQDWPGGVPRLRTTRENIGVIVLGCNYVDGSKGRIRLFLSDNLDAASAKSSVQQFLADPSSGAAAVAGWPGLAAYAPKSGDFVWAHGPVFINLVVEHPDLAADKATWARRLAELVEARMPN